MKICILTHTFPRFPGDSISSIFMAELANSFAASGNKVWVLTPFTPGFRRTSKSYKVLTYKYIYPNFLHKLGYSETLNNDMGLPLLMWFLSPFMYLFALIALLRLIKSEKIELISAHWILPNGFIASVASFFTGIPVISTLPGSDVYMAKKNKLFNLLAKFAVQKSNWITSNSGELISDLEKITKEKIKNKSSIIPYGIGYKGFKPNPFLRKQTRKDLSLKDDNIMVLGVGRLVEKKGFRYLIKAARKVLYKNNHTRFFLVGDGDIRTTLENLVEKLGMRKNFKFLGSIPYREMCGFYNAADIFVLPSIRDRQGNLDDQSVAVLDAMSCGKPVITTDFPGYALVIDKDKTGFLTKAKDVAKITFYIKALSRSRSLRLKIGEASRKAIETKFSWARISKIYMDLFENIIKKREQSYYSEEYPQLFDKSSRTRIARQLFKVLTSKVSMTKNLDCLDLGCSAGIMSAYYSKYFKRVVGIDVDDKALALANEMIKVSKRKNLLFLKMDAQKMKFEDRAFDVIFCNQLYQFLENPKLMVSEAYRVLKPGGVMIFSGANKFSIIEQQSRLPLIHFLPEVAAQIIAKKFGKIYHPSNYKNYFEIREMLSNFEILNMTPLIMKNPDKYGFEKLAKFEKYTSSVPIYVINFFTFLSPNAILICKRPLLEEAL